MIIIRRHKPGKTLVKGLYPLVASHVFGVQVEELIGGAAPGQEFAPSLAFGLLVEVLLLGEGRDGDDDESERDEKSHFFLLRFLDSLEAVGRVTRLGGNLLPNILEPFRLVLSALRNVIGSVCGWRERGRERKGKERDRQED